MKIKTDFKHSSLKQIAFILIIFIILAVQTLGFYSNKWNVVDQDSYNKFQITKDGRIIGRLIKSKNEGAFSDGAIIGRYVSPGQKKPNDIFQYEIFEKNIDVSSFKYRVYKTYIGLQTVIYTILGRFLNIPREKFIDLLGFINSLLLAIILSFFIIWLKKKFDFLTAFSALLAIIFSGWLTLISKSLFWQIWSFYFPIILLIYIFEIKKRNTSFLLIFAASFCAILIKCFFNTFEYITTAIIAMFVPIVFYAYEYRLKFVLFMKQLGFAFLGSISAIFVAVLILIIQIYKYTGSIQESFKHIFVYSLEKRTYGDPNSFPEIYAKSLKASPLSVIWTYLKIDVFDFNHIFGTSSPYLEIPAYLFIVILLFFSILFLFLRSRSVRNKQREKQTMALLVATWFSILAPLSWFMIFKAHSYIHTKTNPVIWSIPFLFFGSALIGAIIYFTFENFYFTKKTLSRIEPKSSQRQRHS